MKYAMEEDMAYPEPKTASMWPIQFISATWIFVTLLMASCSGNHKQEQVPYYITADFTPHWKLPLERDHKINSFTCFDQEGNPITENQLNAKLTLVNFFFTGCGSICPKMTQVLKAVADTFRNENTVQLISFSVTPWIDSLPRLQKFAARYEINPVQWKLLRGKKEEIYPLARQSFFAEEEIGLSKDNSEFLHTEHVLLIDGNRRIRGIYNGTQALEAEKMILDIRLLKSEM